MHGYGIALYIQQTTEEVLRVEEGTLYPTLQRMLIKSWVQAEWRTTENKRRARYYTLTPMGREQLAAEVRDFERAMTAIRQVIEPA
jgi:transcriptional regulator